MQDAMGPVMLLIVLLLYFLPSIVAAARHHRSEGAIVALNILAGWTFFGWVAALVWALTYQGERMPR